MQKEAFNVPHQQENKNRPSNENVRRFIIEMMLREKAWLAELESNQAAYQRFYADASIVGRLKQTAAVLVGQEPIDSSLMLAEKGQRLEKLGKALAESIYGNTAPLEDLILRDLNYWCARTMKLERLATDKMASWCFSPREIEHIKWFWKRSIAVLKEIDGEKYNSIEEQLLS